MKQDDFVARHSSEWDDLARWLQLRASPKRRDRALDGTDLPPDLEFPARYRRLCQALAVAEKRGYSPVVVDRLRELVHAGHAVLYRPPAPRWQRMAAFFLADFPRLVRAHGVAMGVSFVLLFAPMIAIGVTLQYRPELIHAIFDPPQVAQFEAMYDPANAGERLGRDGGTDLRMFGHYVMNNVSIGFRTFASGLLAGVGPVFVVVFNGVVIGAVAGHLTAIGYGGPFWRFVVGHSAPELLAIVITGGAGLTIGMALIAPGRRTRGRALVETGVDGAKLALGAFGMLVFAAFVEAYWSSMAWVPDPLRYGVAASMWLSILAWLWLGGRGARG